MANPFVQYIRDTRAELKHVAWPTRMQTIVYTALVAAISLAIAAYLGAFDFLFTTGLGEMLDVLPAGSVAPLEQTSPITITPATTTTTPATNSTSNSNTPTFGIPGTTNQTNPTQ